MSRPLLLIALALTACAPEHAAQTDVVGDEGTAQRGMPDKNDRDFDPVGRDLRNRNPRLSPGIRRALGGQEGEPVWTGGGGNAGDDDGQLTDDATASPPAPPPPEPPEDPDFNEDDSGDTGDTGL